MFELQTNNLLLQCGLGVYVSGKAIHDDASSNSFSCNSNA